MSKTARRRSTPEERAAKIEALHADLTAAIQTLLDDDAWQQMLAFAAQFHTYSLNNQILLWAQSIQRGIAPTQFAGVSRWNKLGRRVIAGSRGFKVFAPVRVRLSQAEAEKRGPQGFDADGKPRMVVRGFRVEHVFDLSQTEGDPVPEAPSPRALLGDGPDGLWEAVAAQVVELGYAIVREQTPGLPEAYGSVTFTERLVRVRPDVDPAQACKTLIHELAHILAEHDERKITRGQRETEAESVAFIVGHMFGLDTVEYSAPYVAAWSNGEVEVIQAAMQAVRAAADRITGALEARLAPAGDLAGVA